MSSIILKDFSGGVNLRDAPALLDSNELPFLFNWRIAPSGALVPREKSILCYTPSGTPERVFWSSAVNRLFVQIGTTVYRVTVGSALGTGSSETSTKVFTTSALAAFCDFNGKMVMVHPVDGVFDVDAAFTVTSRSTTVKGTCIAAWQNKVWVGGDSSNPTRIWWSDAGTSATWTTASSFVDVRDVDDNVITALFAGGGMDVQGRAGLLVFKANSMYRINSSTTGAYTTMDAAVGCVGSQAVDAWEGVVAFLGVTGLYVTDGVAKPRKVSGKIDPVFLSFDQALPNNRAFVRGWRRGFAFAGQSANLAPAFEYNIDSGAITIHGHNNGSGNYSGPSGATRYKSSDELIFFDWSETKVGWLWTDATAKTAFEETTVLYKLQSPWLILDDLKAVRVHRMLVMGRSDATTLTFGLRKDWNETAVSRSEGVLLTSSSTVSAAVHETNSLGVAKAISVELSATMAPTGDTISYPTPNLNFEAADERGRAPYIAAIRFDYEKLDNRA